MMIGDHGNGNRPRNKRKGKIRNFTLGYWEYGFLLTFISSRTPYKKARPGLAPYLFLSVLKHKGSGDTAGT